MTLRGWHRPRLAVLAEAGADVLALETIPCAAEAEALLAEIDGLGRAGLVVADLCRRPDSGRRGGRGGIRHGSRRGGSDSGLGSNCCDAAEVAGPTLQWAGRGLWKTRGSQPEQRRGLGCSGSKRWTGSSSFDTADVDSCG